MAVCERIERRGRWQQTLNPLVDRGVATTQTSGRHGRPVTAMRGRELTVAADRQEAHFADRSYSRAKAEAAGRPTRSNPN